MNGYIGYGCKSGTARVPYETKAILSVHREIQEKKRNYNGHVLKIAIEDIRLSIKQYYRNLEKDNRTLKKTRAKIVSIDKNRITLSIESKIPVIESIEFEIQDKVFNQGDIIIEDYDDVKLTLKVRAMRSAATINWADIQLVMLISDTKFLVKNLDKWYDGNAGRLSYPPIPSLRKGTYAGRTIYQRKKGKDRNIHGLVYDEPWHYDEPVVSEDRVSVLTWYDFKPGTENYESFPFKHRVYVRYELTDMRPFYFMLFPSSGWSKSNSVLLIS